MAYVDESSSRSGVVELNLVPFIDLMSVCIIFLLITAVWIQVSMIQLGTSIYSKQTSAEAPPPAPSPHSDIPFRVDVKSEGYQVILGSQKWVIPLKRNGAYDHKQLTQKIKEVKSLYPEKENVVVTSQDKLIYKHLIMAMDLLLASGFPGISISTGEVI